MSERRDDRLDRIEQSLEALIASHEHWAQRASLRKNGESWKQYLGKVITPDRVLLAAVLIFQFGGKVQTLQSDMSGLVTREKAMVQTSKELTEQISASRDLQSVQSGVVMDLMRETNRLSAVARQVDDRISRTVTRSEFNAAISQQLIPRLNRIERTLKLDP